MSITQCYYNAFKRSQQSGLDRHGATWYKKSQRMVDTLAHRHGLQAYQVAGIVAALSPRVTWKINCRDAVAICKHGSSARVSGTHANVRKAIAIVNGMHPEDVLGGNKVKAFYRCILGQDDIVIDTWMVKAAERDNNKPLTDNQYGELSQTLRIVASIVQLPVSTVQASIWLKVRMEGTK